jgi:hypothetical protein
LVPATSSDEYRRQARRLRCVYAGQPARLQQSLKALATRVGATAFAVSVEPSRPALPATSGPARIFAEQLAAEISPTGILRYSHRLALLRSARRLGVGRFEANLLIAAVLERRRRAGQPIVVESELTRDGSFVSNLAVFLIVQGALAAGAWWTVFR